jgi:hypothetical protein
VAITLDSGAELRIDNTSAITAAAATANAGIAIHGKRARGATTGRGAG